MGRGMEISSVVQLRVYFTQTMEEEEAFLEMVFFDQQQTSRCIGERPI
jgi:hypothetical protein